MGIETSNTWVKPTGIPLALHSRCLPIRWADENSVPQVYVKPVEAHLDSIVEIILNE